MKEIKRDEKKPKKFGSGKKKKKSLTGGATGAATGGMANKPPKKDNPLKRELNNPQGLDFANQAGSLMAQPKTIELLTSEQTTSGVKLESTRTLRTKTNITDVSMQGRRSFTFEYEGTFHNPRFYEAKVKFSIKLINAPRVATIGGQGYQQYRVRNATNDGWVDSPYGPITLPNWLPEFLFEKATIEVLGGTEIEPGTQTHQITKLVDFHTKMKPEEAAFKYSNLGGYYEEYDSKMSDQKYGVPIQFNAATGAIEQIAGKNYKQVTQTQFTAGSTGGANENYQYTTEGAAKLAASFHNGQERHFEVPLRHLCRLAKCKQIFPSGKKYFITLHTAKESFLLCSQDPGAHQNVIFQLTDCTIDVPIVELQPEKQEERKR